MDRAVGGCGKAHNSKGNNSNGVTLGLVLFWPPSSGGGWSISAFESRTAAQILSPFLLDGHYDSESRESSVESEQNSAVNNLKTAFPLPFCKPHNIHTYTDTVKYLCSL